MPTFGRPHYLAWYFTWALLYYNKKRHSICNNVLHCLTLAIRPIFHSSAFFVIWLLQDQLRVLRGDLKSYHDPLLFLPWVFKRTVSQRGCKPVPNWAPYHLFDPNAICRKFLICKINHRNRQTPLWGTCAITDIVIFECG